MAMKIVDNATNVAVETTKGGDFNRRFAGTITGIGAYTTYGWRYWYYDD